MSATRAVTIVDYGMGNVGSIRNMLRKVGATPVVTSEPAELAKAVKVVLPGVGAFDQGMEKLEASGLRQVLDELVLARGVPILGICLGMQLFGRASEEGRRSGLGWLVADSVRFRQEGAAPGLRVPHMGWNAVTWKKTIPLVNGLDGQQRFYFLHSFHMRCADGEDVLAETVHGYGFPSAVVRKNVLGVQFHPEKSHLFGMAFFRNFVELF